MESSLIADLKDERFKKIYDGVREFYSYVYCRGIPSAPWSSRTSYQVTRYRPRENEWKGLPGPSFTVSINNANELFCARRANYYIVTYHGRLTPTWLGEGFHGQIGYGGGAICQLTIPGAGTVLASTLNGAYGKRMHISNWRNFHIHSLVGRTGDGRPLVSANSEHFDARLEGNTVTSAGEVRQSSVRVLRSYTFESSFILCRAKLEPSVADNFFSLWGGRPHLRILVEEAYEMIPFIDLPRKQRTARWVKRGTRVVALDAKGQELGELTTNPIKAFAVLIDRRGYGVRIDLDQPRPVLRGNNDTVLIVLAEKPTPVKEIEISYRIIPYVGEPPTTGIGGAREEHAINVVDIKSLDQVPTALAKEKLYKIKAGRETVSELRFALAGRWLALDARVRDTKIIQNPVPWKNSCLEVFGSMPGETKIGQVFLVPGVGNSPPRAYIAKGQTQVPAQDVKLASREIEGGYTLQALIPVNLLALDPSKGRVLLEFQITATKSVDKKGRAIVQGGTLFKSRLAYLHNTSYGFFVIQKEGRGEK